MGQIVEPFLYEKGETYSKTESIVSDFCTTHLFLALTFHVKSKKSKKIYYVSRETIFLWKKIDCV